MRFCTTCGEVIVPSEDASSREKITVTLADLDGGDVEATRPPRRELPIPPPPGSAVATASRPIPRVETGRPVPGRPTPLEELGFELSADDAHPILPHTEVLIARFGVVGAAWSTPPGALESTTTSLRLQPTFDGVGEIAITATRIVGVLHVGTAGGVEIPARPGAFVGWDFPLTAIAEVGLDLNTRWHGHTDQVGLRVWAFEPAPAMLRLDVTAEIDAQMREHRITDQRDAMRTLVAAACDARMKGADDIERLRLVEVRAGQWHHTDGEITAEIVQVGPIQG